ncbi:MAG: flavodoxin-dependent (E)-4-hydroxy-3-methylbut-2-enyl-diphosphate synthase [Candidatus Omnitrophica bacterium]|nr:flavodoxin-dependent (E)-4-hydroxy-3-methylbut-2-enyl-diphosphate synthase [Candidatus Omnitrophota bacterium]
MIKRRKTRQVRVGDVKVGGTAPISIQSMAKTDTRDVSKTIKQIKRLEKLGCEIIRVAVLDSEAARAIKKIKKKINIPLIADIHFHYNLAIEAIISGADKIRLNPGNVKNKEDIAQVVKLAKKRRIPIRIGVNSGSLPIVSPRSPLANAMTKAAVDYIKIFESLGFNDIIISLKASDVTATLEAYREMARLCDYPFHLGVTAAGPSEHGIVKSSIGIGTLLAEGIGDTIRVSLTEKPEEEIKIAKGILSSLGLRKFGVDIVSCPTCGRCKVNLARIVKEFEKKLQSENYCRRLTSVAERGARGNSQLFTEPLKVAIMGCVVNGPGEAKDADIGIAAGKKNGILFKNGRIVRKVKEADFVKVLLDEMD